MYNVLIVDDDPIICTGLQKLINWQEYGFLAEDYALNGLEALDLIGKNTYDLIITDIRMPRIDGIELIKKLRERHHDSKIIVLSGYRDFEYAQVALEYGVKKYILKPVNEKILIDTVVDVKSEIEEDIKQKLVLKESRIILKENIILDLLKSAESNTLSDEKLKILGMDMDNKTFQVCIMERFVKDEKSIAVSGLVIKKAIQDIVGKQSAGYISDIGNNKIAFILCFDSKSSLSALAVCEEIYDYVNKYTGYAVNISIGNQVSQYTLIGESFRNASMVHTDCLFSKEQHILVYNDIATKKTIEYIIKYVRENCCERLTLQSISNKFFFNPVYIGRIFKSYTGLKFNDYLIDCKIEESIKLMEDAKYRVCDIARKVGYTDFDHFCKVFKAKKGCTPSEYKSGKNMQPPLV